MTGKVKWFSATKGYGFIEHPEFGDIFVHFSAIKVNGFRTLIDGRTVEYELIQGARGIQAANVRQLAVEK